MSSAFFSAMPPQLLTSEILTPYSSKRLMMVRAPKAVA